jgi:hypothetical protein
MNTNYLFDNLLELSDKDLQEALWLGKVKGQLSTFPELISQIFDGTGLAEEIDENTLGNQYSKGFCEKAIELRNLVNDLPYNISSQKLIDHPDMPRVRLVSKQLADLLQQETAYKD